MSSLSAPQINQSNSQFVYQLCEYLASKTENSQEELWKLISDKSFEEVNTRSTEKKTKQKRNKTPYNMFCSDKEVQESLKELPFKDRSKKTSELWKQLDETSKDKYVVLAKEKNESSPVEKEQKDKKDKKPRKKTSYNVFLADKEVRLQIQNDSTDKLTMPQINKIMIEKWKSMSQEDKKKYVDKANELNSELN